MYKHIYVHGCVHAYMRNVNNLIYLNLLIYSNSTVTVMMLWYVIYVINESCYNSRECV